MPHIENNMNENNKIFQCCNSYAQDRALENGITMSDFSSNISSDQGNHIDSEEDKGLDIEKFLTCFCDVDLLEKSQKLWLMKMGSRD